MGDIGMILSEHPRIELLNMDCMSYMAGCRDKQFNLAIVDPPYGIKESKRYNYHPNASTKYLPKKWDNNVPKKKYFKELFRISVNQIIWGGNYFNLPAAPKFIIWDKNQPEGIDQAMAEFAWSSNKNIQTKIFKRSPSLDKNCISMGDKRARQKLMRIHPTQKPVKLYEWLLINYAKPGDTILDTHGGSFSSAIAAYRLGFNFTGIELDADYFKAAVKRFKEQTAQLDAFRQPKPATVTQLTLNPYGDKLCPNCNRHHSEAGSFCCTACEFGI